MPITAKQRELRRKHIGASDLPAIWGISRYRTPYDVWLEKTGRVAPSEGGDAALAGVHLEAGVLRFAEAELGKLRRNQYRSVVGLPLAANLDAIVVASGAPVEAKTRGLHGPLTEPWGLPGTDEVPDDTILQCQAQLMCVGSTEVAHVAALLGGRGLALFHVHASHELAETIAAVVDRFWRCVTSDTPPPSTSPSYDVIRRARRVPKKTVCVPSPVLDQYERACAHLRAAEEAKKQAQAAVLASMGDAEAGWDGGTRLFTYCELTRAGYTVAATTYRSPRLRYLPPEEIENVRCLVTENSLTPALPQPADGPGHAAEHGAAEPVTGTQIDGDSPDRQACADGR
ncbi:MAG: lambda-exonuclease family protein [Pseudomonadota bacterium]